VNRRKRLRIRGGQGEGTLFTISMTQQCLSRAQSGGEGPGGPLCRSRKKRYLVGKKQKRNVSTPRCFRRGRNQRRTTDKAGQLLTKTWALAQSKGRRPNGANHEPTCSVYWGGPEWGWKKDLTYGPRKITTIYLRQRGGGEKTSGKKNSLRFEPTAARGGFTRTAGEGKGKKKNRAGDEKPIKKPKPRLQGLSRQEGIGGREYTVRKWVP